MEEDGKKLSTGIIFILITALAFSTMEIVGKMISTEFNPFQITFIRFLIGGLILLPLALMEKSKRSMTFGVKDYGFFILSGFLAITVSMTFFQLAIIYTKASIVAVIFSTNAIFTIPLANMMLKEKIHSRMILSVIASVVGILLIFNPFSVSADIKGIVYAVIAAVTFSIYTVVNKTKIEKYGGLILNCFSFLIGDALLLIILLFYKIPLFSGLNSSNIWEILYLGIFVTGIGYLSYFEGIKRTSAITGSMVFFIKPALAPMLSLAILHEKITLNTGLGIICIVFGAFISFVQKPSAKQMPGKEPAEKVLKI